MEEKILNFLKDRGFTCYMEEPVKKPSEYVLVEKTGSSDAGDGLYSSLYAFKSYSTSMYKASNLNEKVKAAVMDMPQNIPGITDATLNSDYNFTDTDTRRYRYQSVFDIIHF